MNERSKRVVTIMAAAILLISFSSLSVAQKRVDTVGSEYYLYGESMSRELESDIGRIMQERYGVKLVRAAGCVLTAEQREKWDTNNRSVSEAAGLPAGKLLFEFLMAEREKQQDKLEE